MSFLPAETEIEFLQDENSRWYIAKAKAKKEASRFRTTHQQGKLTVSTENIITLTRGES